MNEKLFMRMNFLHHSSLPLRCYAKLGYSVTQGQ